MIAHTDLRAGVVLESERHQVLIIGTSLPKFPETGVVVPEALAQTDFTQDGYAVLAYAINKRTGEGTFRPIDRTLLTHPNFISDFSEVGGAGLSTTKRNLLEQALSDVSGQYAGCDPRLFHVLNFIQVKGDIEKLLE